MATDRDEVSGVELLKPLSRDQLAERIHEVAGEILAGVASELPSADAWDDWTRPRWIRAADLVRRMQPYIVYN